MLRYDDKFIETLKSRIILSDVIGKRLTIIHRGRNKVALCPFHHEKTPSFNIDDQRNFYHCFGCGESGDVISFLMKTDGLSFAEAVEKLAEDYDVPLPQRVTNASVDIIDKEIVTLYKINEEACSFFEKNLLDPIGKNALNYLKRRGLTLENMKQFRLGYASNNFTSLLNYLVTLGFKETDIQKAGLISEGTNNSSYDKFRNRVIFPVLDKKGRVIAFTGRVLGDALPKYMNSPETSLYHKSQILFNYFLARKFIYDENRAILVEGNMDVISLYVNGVRNCLAPMGTAITMLQIEEILRLCDEVIICLDGDEAGQKAMVRLSKLVLGSLVPKKIIKFVVLPSKEDPDSFIRSEGRAAFLKYIEDNASHLSEFLFDNELRNLNIKTEDTFLPPEIHSILESNLRGLVSNIKDRMVARNFDQFFRNKVFNLFKFKYYNPKVSYNTITKINYNRIIPTKGSLEEIKADIIACEKSILGILLDFPDLIDELFQNYNVDIFNFDFLDDKTNQVKNILMEMYEQDSFVDKQKLFDSLKQADLYNFIFAKFKLRTIDKSKALKELYVLVMECNELLIKKELKNLIIANENEERRAQLENELKTLLTKKEKFKRSSNNI